MVRTISIEEFYNKPTSLIDVRSPGEFKKGHIPGAVNIPLFSDEERAHIGTIYVQVSQEKATALAYEYVRPKLNDFLIESEKVGGKSNITIHCWRGGMRSMMFARHLHDNGFKNVSVITGGYKAYRNYILSSFSIPVNLKIIGGFTGSGKTQVLKELCLLGEQVIDLEELAHHKGSAFGHIGLDHQPTSEQFENDLFVKWHKVDRNKPVWIEDESRNIGGVNIPMALYEQMQKAQIYFIHIPREKRAKNLVKEYTGSDPARLMESVQKLTKRLGGLNTSKAMQLISDGNYYEAVMITLGYYDKAYSKSLNYRNNPIILNVDLDEIDAVSNAKILLNLSKSHAGNKINTV